MGRERPLVLALDVGGTRFRIALANGKGELLKRLAEPVTSPDDPEKTLKRIAERARELLAGIDPADVRGMGIAIAGLVKPVEGVLLTSPNLPAWYNTSLKEIWERELDLPVWVCNDASAAALGEHMFGAGRGVDDLVYLTVSTGIGGGVIAGGRLLTGADGFGAELGHMTIDLSGPVCNCGNTGCLEMLASGTAIARFAAERISRGEASAITERVGGDVSGITAEVVAEFARAGDTLASEVMHWAGSNLGVGIVNLAHIFNPGVVIIGGGVSKTGELIFGPARQVIAERVMRDIEVRVVPAALGDDPGLLGAVAMVVRHTPD